MKSQVIGIAGILPLDYTFVLDTGENINAAIEELKGKSVSEWDKLRVGFNYISFHRSGGGKVANILAFLGISGHKVAVCGSIGNDKVGQLVKHDLIKYKIDLDYLQTEVSKNTRIVFVVYKAGNRKGKQIHKKPTPLSRFSKSNLENLPLTDWILISGVNKSITEYIQKTKQKFGTKITYHLNNYPWRKEAKDYFKAILSMTNLLVVWESNLNQLQKDFNLKSKDDLNELVEKLGTEVIVIYGGLNKIKAIIRKSGKIILPKLCSEIQIQEPTGMMECFHGALVSFFLNKGWLLEGNNIMKAAISYANEIAAINGSGTGARNFPSLLEQTSIRKIYWNLQNEFEYDIAISFAGEDRKLAEKIAERLKSKNFQVFYDKYEQANLWGKNLYTHLNEVYSKKAKFCLMIISKFYASKQWTNHERKAAQERAFKENQEYILPIRLDDTEISGLLDTTAYIDYREISFEDLIELLNQKLS